MWHRQINMQTRTDIATYRLHPHTGRLSEEKKLLNQKCFKENAKSQIATKIFPVKFQLRPGKSKQSLESNNCQMDLQGAKSLITVHFNKITLIMILFRVIWFWPQQQQHSNVVVMVILNHFMRT